MSKSTTNNLATEISAYWRTSLTANNEWFFVEQILQIIDREKIMVINRYRKNHDEPPLIPEPMRYKGVEQQHTEWIIDVPKPWTNLISKLSNS
jgi:hypothetical protein